MAGIAPYCDNLRRDLGEGGEKLGAAQREARDCRNALTEIVVASQIAPMPIQKGSGYMVMSSESALNTQLPCAKNKLWNTANSPSKSIAAHIPKMAKIAIVPKPAQSKTVPNVLLPLAQPDAHGGEYGRD